MTTNRSLLSFCRDMHSTCMCGSLGYSMFHPIECWEGPYNRCPFLLCVNIQLFLIDSRRLLNTEEDDCICVIGNLLCANKCLSTVSENILIGPSGTLCFQALRYVVSTTSILWDSVFRPCVWHFIASKSNLLPWMWDEQHCWKNIITENNKSKPLTKPLSPFSLWTNIPGAAVDFSLIRLCPHPQLFNCLHNSKLILSYFKIRNDKCCLEHKKTTCDLAVTLMNRIISIYYQSMIVNFVKVLSYCPRAKGGYNTPMSYIKVLPFGFAKFLDPKKVWIAFCGLRLVGSWFRECIMHYVLSLVQIPPVPRGKHPPLFY